MFIHCNLCVFGWGDTIVNVFMFACACRGKCWNSFIFVGLFIGGCFFLFLFLRYVKILYHINISDSLICKWLLLACSHCFIGFTLIVWTQKQIFWNISHTHTVLSIHCVHCVVLSNCFSRCAQLDLPWVFHLLCPYMCIHLRALGKSKHEKI